MEARFLYFLKKAFNLSTEKPSEDSALEIFVIYCLKKFNSKYIPFSKKLNNIVCILLGLHL